MTSHGEFTDGKRGTREYWIWSGMKDRCYRESHKDFKYYGGRGILVCDEWRNDYSRFLLDMGRAPSDQHSIDREDPDGNYCASNYRWATTQEQNENQRRTKRVAGMLLTEASRISGIKYATLLKRFNSGLSDEDILAELNSASRRRNARMITANGVTKSESEWCRDIGVAVGVVGARVARGIHPEVAVKTPGRS